jgi:hypothetical protein
MPHSHYAEKARWALDYLALPFVERPQLPLFHRFATRPHGGTSVPVLVHNRRGWIDSSAILMWADEAAGGDVLFPRDEVLRSDVLALQDRFDKVLGPHTRRWGYAQLLGRRDIIASMATRSVPRVQARWAPLVMLVFMPLIKRAFNITPETTVRSRERIDAVLKRSVVAWLMAARSLSASASAPRISPLRLFPRRCCCPPSAQRIRRCRTCPRQCVTMWSAGAPLRRAVSGSQFTRAGAAPEGNRVPLRG